MKYILTILFLTFWSYYSFCQNPVADFEFLVDYKCGYATTEFINKSVNADTFLWDVNGTGYYNETYEPRGSNMTLNNKWIVTLIAKGSGLSDTISKEVEVFNSKIKFDTALYNISDYAPLTIGFSNISEIREDETITYHWDFGDGTQSIEDSPIHTYDVPNTYYATLTGTKSDGCELSYSETIIVKDTAQKGEFEFINSNCIIELEASPCGYNKQFELINDSLIVYGFYYGNCGAVKTATVNYSGDTVKIRTWQVGEFTTCNCGYCFEINIPNITKDSIIVTFDGEKISKVLTDVVEYENTNVEINVFPNPTNDCLTLIADGIDLTDFEYMVFNTEGQILKTGFLSVEPQLDTQNLKSGLYMLLISDMNRQKKYVIRFIKK